MGGGFSNLPDQIDHFASGPAPEIQEQDRDGSGHSRICFCTRTSLDHAPSRCPQMSRMRFATCSVAFNQQDKRTTCYIAVAAEIVPRKGRFVSVYTDRFGNRHQFRIPEAFMHIPLRQQSKQNRNQTSNHQRRRSCVENCRYVYWQRQQNEQKGEQETNSNHRDRDTSEEVKWPVPEILQKTHSPHVEKTAQETFEAVFAPAVNAGVMFHRNLDGSIPMNGSQ